MTADLLEIVTFLNEYLNIDNYEDRYCLNGLQVEASQVVKRVSVAVDPSLRVIEEAAQKSSLLITHHGLISHYTSPLPLTGVTSEKLRLLFKGSCSLYCAHLPLDGHMEVGNSCMIADALGLRSRESFANLGMIGTFAAPRERADIAEIIRELILDSDSFIQIKNWEFGDSEISRVAILTGAGASFMEDAINAGADLLITGEAKHHEFYAAREAGMNVILMGHYASEVGGVIALGKLLEHKYGVEYDFINDPSGV